MRISDWSSDVCSSDLGADIGRQPARQALAQERQAPHPLAPVELGPEQQRRVVLEHPFQQLQGRLRIGPGFGVRDGNLRSEEHTSELQSLMRISYAVFCLKKKKTLDQYIIKGVTELPKQHKDRDDVT